MHRRSDGLLLLLRRLGLLGRLGFLGRVRLLGALNRGDFGLIHRNDRLLLLLLLLFQQLLLSPPPVRGVQQRQRAHSQWAVSAAA